MYIRGNQTTLLQRIKDTEFAEFIKTYSGAIEINIDTSTDDRKFVKGNVILNVDPNSVEVNSLLHYQGFINNKQSTNMGNSRELFENVSNKILSTDDALPLEDALEFINTYVSVAKSNFYGAILKSADGSVTFNPFHPLTAPLLIANLDTYSKHKYKCILYFYNDRRAMDSIFNTVAADRPITEMIVNSFIKTVVAQTIRTAVLESVVVTPIPIDDCCTLSARAKRNLFTESTVGTSSLFVAHQMLTRGVMVPYYGISYLDFTLNQTCRGAHISPMRSVNISASSGNTATIANRLVFNSVCCGSKNNTTIEGIRTLQHANLNSPYNTQTLVDGALHYVDVCITKTLQMYRLAGLIKSNTQDLTVALSPIEEWTTDDCVQQYTNSRLPFLRKLNEALDQATAIAVIKELKRKINELTPQSNPT